MRFPRDEDELREPKRAVRNRRRVARQRRAVREHVRELAPQLIRRLTADEGGERDEGEAEERAEVLHDGGAAHAERGARQRGKTHAIRDGGLRRREEIGHRRERPDGGGEGDLPPHERRDGAEIPSRRNPWGRRGARRRRRRTSTAPRILTGDGHGDAGKREGIVRVREVVVRVRIRGEGGERAEGGGADDRVAAAATSGVERFEAASARRDGGVGGSARDASRGVRASARGEARGGRGDRPSRAGPRAETEAAE